MNENFVPTSYGCAEGPEADITFRLSELPDVHVIVNGVAYFTYSGGFLAFCDNPNQKSVSGYMPITPERSFLCENAYLSDQLTFGGITPDVHTETIEHIMSALDALRRIDLEGLKDAI
jgi:hypothetical protein